MYWFRYVDRLIDNLKRQLALVDKHHNIKLDMVNRRADAGVESRFLQPKLKALIAETKEWQKLVSFVFDCFFLSTFSS